MVKPRERWLEHATELAKEPASISVDLSLMDPEARAPSCETLLAVGAQLGDPGKNGCGTEQDQAQLQAALEQLISALEGDSGLSGTTQIAGAYTTGGAHQILLYTSIERPSNLIPTIEEIARGHGWEHWIHAERDADWSHYTKLLLPSPAVRIQTMNDRSLQAFTARGHDLSTPRRLTHTLLFPSEPAAELALESMVALDFEPAAAMKTYREKARVKVHRVDPLDHIQALTMMLSELAAPYDGDHLKWTATEA